MENNDGMRGLVNELLKYFYTSDVTYPEEMATPYSFNPNGLLTKDFYQNVKVVLFTKLMVVHSRWETFLAMKFCNMFSSHEMYLRYVMISCGLIAHFSDNIFDKLLSVYTLVLYFNIETLKTAGVNFCELTNDIFMVYYEEVLKEPFNRNGGIERLVEYISHHEYLTWKWHWKDIISPGDPHIFVTHIQEDLVNKIYKELSKEPCFPEFISHDHVLWHSPSLSLAQKVLCTRNQLPPLPSSNDLEVKLLAMTQEKASKLEEGKRRVELLEAELRRSLCSNFNSVSNYNIEQKMNDA